MNRKNALYMVSVLAVGILLTWSCKEDTAVETNPGGSSNTVTMTYSSFVPSSLTVSRGTTVTWRNNDNIAHTSTSTTGLWNTGSIPPGESRTTTFDTVGTFGFYCGFHPTMTGSITVN